MSNVPALIASLREDAEAQDRSDSAADKLMRSAADALERLQGIEATLREFVDYAVENGWRDDERSLVGRAREVLK